MSDLRIRSEAVRDEIWAQPFLPRQARVPDGFDDDDADFGPFLTAAGRALTLLFGAAVEVLPGRPPGNDSDRLPGAPPVAPVLAAWLATLRLGGDPGRGVEAAGVSGVALARYARQIAEALDAAALKVWPAPCTLAGFDLDIACGSVAGHAHVAAPPAAPPSVTRGERTKAQVELFDLPMRVRIEIASDQALVASLLPLRTGTVLPINPVPEMPLLVGDHRIGRATVAALADGRQLATIVAMQVEPAGGRA